MSDAIDQIIEIKSFIQCIELLSEFFKGSEKMVVWMQTKNPLLGDYTPFEIIAAGRSEKLLKFIQAQLEENKRI